MDNDYDKHVESIYKKVLITRSQISKRTKETTNNTVTTQLNKAFAKYYDLLGNPRVSEYDMQKAQRDMTDTLDLCVMHTDEDVIKILTNELITEKYKQKALLTL